MANKAYPPSICPGIPRLGKCPTGWTTCTFGDVLTVVERLVPIADESVYQLVTAKRNRGGIVPREQLKGREIKTQGQYTVRKGDFLIGNRQIIHGACGIVPESLDGAIVSGEYTVLLPKKGLWLPWLAYFAHTVHFQQTCFQSSIGVDVEKMVFKVDWWLKQLLHVPPLAEQKHIVEILSTWADAIEQTRTFVSAAKRRKDDLLQKVLNGQTRLPSFASVEKRIFGVSTHREKILANGDVPNDWQPYRIYELGQVVSGGTPDTGNPNFWGGEISWITPSEITSLPTPFVSETKRTLSKSGLKSSSATLLPANSLIVCTRATVGDCAINLVPMTTNQGFKNVIVLKDKIDVVFLYYWICLHKNVLLRLASGSTFVEVSKNNFENILINCPTLPEQRAIAAVLSTADDEISGLEAEVNALERQKKGLMQQLLTGKMRVRTSKTI